MHVTGFSGFPYETNALDHSATMPTDFPTYNIISQTQNTEVFFSRNFLICLLNFIFFFGKRMLESFAMVASKDLKIGDNNLKVLGANFWCKL